MDTIAWSAWMFVTGFARATWTGAVLFIGPDGEG